MGDIAETNLDILVKNMQPVLKDETYVFHSSDISFSYAAKLKPIMLFREDEGLTIILNKKIAQQENINYVYESCVITLNVNSSLDAIGFLAKITAALANKNISVNPVSAYFHDHLFIPKDKASLAIKTLNELAGK